MIKLRMALVLCLASALAGGLSPATAATGGRSANAKTCQKGGYRTVYRADGSSFASENDCVAYGARGGTYLTAPPKPQAQRDCESFGGTYGQNDVLGFPENRPVVFTCNGYAYNGENTGALGADCYATVPGAVFEFQTYDPSADLTCYG